MTVAILSDLWIYYLNVLPKLGIKDWVCTKSFHLSEGTLLRV